MPRWDPLPCSSEAPAAELWLLPPWWGGIPHWPSKEISAAEELHALSHSQPARTGPSPPSFLVAPQSVALPATLPGPRGYLHASGTAHGKFLMDLVSIRKREFFTSTTAPQQCPDFGGILEGMKQISTSPLGSPGVPPGSLLPDAQRGWPQGAAGQHDAQASQPKRCRVPPGACPKKSSWKFPVTSTAATRFHFLLQKHNRKETTKGAFN